MVFLYFCMKNICFLNEFCICLLGLYIRYETSTLYIHNSYDENGTENHTKKF